MEFNIIICNIDDDLTKLIDKHLPKSNISYYNGDFRNISEPFECIVSPGNSFGLMDGGVDGIIKSYFKHIDNFIIKVQTSLLNQVGGFHQPGSCTMIDVTNDHVNCQFIAHCPTMIVPMKITDYSIIYWCIWNFLISIHKHNINNPTNKIKTVVCPCLGTGVGRFEYEYFIKLFELALENYENYIELMKTDFTNTNHYNIMNWEYASDTYDKLDNLINTFQEKKDDFYDMINSRRNRTT